MINQTPGKESKKVIIQYALFRVENAVILAGAILLTAFFPHPFEWWPIWGWPLLGLLGIGLVFYSSLTNASYNAQLLLRNFQDRFDLSAIRLEDLRQDMQKALEYQQRVDGYLWQKKDDLLWSRPQDTAGQIQDWIENIYQLASQLDTYRRDELTKEEMRRLPEEIVQLDLQRTTERDPAVVKEYVQLLESKEKHLKTLQELDSKMKQAAIHLKQSLSALATVDSQIRLIAAQNVDRGGSDRLRADIQEQVNRLSDLINSINEVYEAK